LPPSFLGIAQRKNNKTKPPTSISQWWRLEFFSYEFDHNLQKKTTHVIEIFNAHILLQIVFHNDQKNPITYDVSQRTLLNV
jgi:hypothetical protein